MADDIKPPTPSTGAQDMQNRLNADREKKGLPAATIASLKKGIKKTKSIVERTEKAFSSPEKFRDIPGIALARGAEKSERALLSLLGPTLGEAIYQSRRAMPGRKAQAIKDVFLSSISAKIGGTGIVGETLANKIRAQRKFSDDPQKEFENVRENFSIVASDLKQVNLNFTKLKKAQEDFAQKITNEITRSERQIKEDVDSVKRQFTEMESKFTRVEDTIKIHKGILDNHELRIKALENRQDQFRDKDKKTKDDDGLGLSDLFDFDKKKKDKPDRRRTRTRPRTSTRPKPNVPKPNVPKPRFPGIGIGSVASRVLGVGGLYLTALELAEYQQQKDAAEGYTQDVKAKERETVVRGGKIAKQGQRPVGLTGTAEGMDRVRALTQRARQRQATKPATQKNRGLFGMGGFPSTQTPQIKQPAFGESFDRQMIEREKSQFLQFGQLPRGFEFLPGQMGRLGSPEAVAARGAMPLGGYGEVAGVPGMPRGGYSGGGGNAAGHTTGPTAGGGAESTYAGGRGTSQPGAVPPVAGGGPTSSDDPTPSRPGEKVDPVKFYSYASRLVTEMGLAGKVPPGGERYGIREGNASEWSRFLYALMLKESSGIAPPKDANGNALPYKTTPAAERTGPGRSLGFFQQNPDSHKGFVPGNLPAELKSIIGRMVSVGVDKGMPSLLSRSGFGTPNAIFGRFQEADKGLNLWKSSPTPPGMSPQTPGTAPGATPSGVQPMLPRVGGVFGVPLAPSGGMMPGLQQQTTAMPLGSFIEGYDPTKRYGGTKSVSERYVNENFLPAMNFIGALGMGKAIGENPYIREGKFYENQQAGVAPGVHSARGHHYGAHGFLASDISGGGYRPSFMRIAGGEKNARRMVSALGDLMFHPEIRKLLSPRELINQNRTVNARGFSLGGGHPSHVHFAPGAGISKETYDKLAKEIFSNPEKFGEAGKNFADAALAAGLWVKSPSGGYMLNPEKFPQGTSAAEVVASIGQSHSSLFGGVPGVSAMPGTSIVGPGAEKFGSTQPQPQPTATPTTRTLTPAMTTVDQFQKTMPWFAKGLPFLPHYGATLETPSGEISEAEAAQILLRKMKGQTVQDSVMTMAISTLGLHEEHQEQELKSFLGRSGKGDANAWCAAFVGNLFKKHNIQPPRNFELATNWHSFGSAVNFDSVKPGDIFVAMRGLSPGQGAGKIVNGKETYGHVAVIVEPPQLGEDGKIRVKVMEGNSGALNRTTIVRKTYTKEEWEKEQVKFRRPDYSKGTVVAGEAARSFLDLYIGKQLSEQTTPWTTETQPVSSVPAVTEPTSTGAAPTAVDYTTLPQGDVPTEQPPEITPITRPPPRPFFYGLSSGVEREGAPNPGMVAKAESSAKPESVPTPTPAAEPKPSGVPGVYISSMPSVEPVPPAAGPASGTAGVYAGGAPVGQTEEGKKVEDAYRSIPGVSQQNLEQGLQSASQAGRTPQDNTGRSGSSGSSTGGGGNHPESSQASPGSGGMGSYGRCFLLYEWR